jgi:dTMP kinase
MPVLKLKRGLLIAIEGIDGSGKSTLARSIYSLLQEKKFPVILTKEPGGTPLGLDLRKALQERKESFALSPRAEFLLFAADRAQHMEQLVQPRLREGYIVISDRMGDSSLVYQGYGRGLDRTIIKQINQWAMHSIMPDVTLHVDVDVDVAMQRIIARQEKITAFEREKKDFFERLTTGFNELYAHRTDIIKIDGNQSPDHCLTQASEQLITWIENRLYETER